MSPEMIRLEMLYAIVCILSVLVGFVAATGRPRALARVPSSVWGLLRTGLSYILLFIRSRQAGRRLEENKSDEKSSEK